MRSWGAELWDQWDSVSAHSQKGIEFLDNYSRFVKDRIAVETEYAKSLRKLVKTYSPKKKEDSEKFTVHVAFRDGVRETGDMAGQHELIAENMNTQVVGRLHELIRELKDERKRNLSEGARLQQQLTSSYAQLEKAKKNYEKSFREAEKAQDNFQRADADLNLSRAEVEKQRMNSSIKGQNSEDYKNEYANQLQKTNTLQNEHYHKHMPQVFQSFQNLDIRRITDFKKLLQESAEIERSVYPILLKCLDGIDKAADCVNEMADSEAVIEKYKSGFVAPLDIPFDDLSNSKQNGSDCGSGGDSNSLPGHTSNHSTPLGHGYPAHRSDTVKGTISAARFKKRANLFTGIFGSNKEDFNELPPNQRAKKIQQKIDEVNVKITQETAARDALLKMKEVYEGNPSLGDPLTITGQLNDSCVTLDKLKTELDKYQAMLDQPDPPAPSPTPPSRHPHHSSPAPAPHLNGGGHMAASSPRSSLASHRTSFSEESISRSSHSPESGISLSHNSLHGSDGGPSHPHHHPQHHSTAPIAVDEADGDGLGDDSSEFYDLEPLPVIGTCRALYNFDGLSEGSMALSEGDELCVIEVDAGDGWTRVRRQPPDTSEGFVPTTYIAVTLHTSC